MIASVELQKTIFKELDKGDYLVAEVVPKDLDKMPLITIQDLNRETNFTKTNKNRFTFSVIIDGWSHSRSSIEVKEVENFIYQSVMGLEMIHYDVEMVDLTMNINLKEEQASDRTIFHSIQQFEITISEKENDINGN